MPRVDGIHFPTGQDMSTGLLGVLDPTSTTVMNEPEARWHYAAMRAQFPDAQVIWRASPDVKPAQVGWDANAYSREIFKSLDFHADRNNGQYPLDILLLNELNLDYERGEDHGDGGAWDTDPTHWPVLYRGLSMFLRNLLPACRQRFKDRHITPRFWFPAWAPGHGEQDPEIVAVWKPVADLFDGVCFHSYRDHEIIQRDIRWYAGQFPNTPLLLGEWNTDGFDGDRINEELLIRMMLQYEATTNTPNLSACYFIWAWAQDASRRSYDIDGNPARLAIWTQPFSTVDTGGDSGPEVPPANPAPPEDIPVVSARPTPRGIDIASYQGYPDWRRVRGSGIEFAFIKATEGTSYRNPTFSSGWSQAPSFGVLPATYHFARPDQNSPEAEAQFFWDTVQIAGVRIGDVFALDLEDLNGSLSKARISIAEWTLRFLRYFKTLSGTRALLYTNVGVIQEHRFNSYPELAEFGLWLAAWAPVMPQPPAPWDLIAVWQSSDNARIDGIDGPVDEDYYNGPIETFSRYGYGQSDPVPGSPEVPTPEAPAVPVPPSPALEELEGLRTKIGYLTNTVADALQKEITTMSGSLGALQAAVDELRRQA